MGKFYLNKLPKEKRIQMIGEFYDTIASLKNREEVRLFFKDLFTPDEIATMMRKIEVAALLMGGCSYRQIEELLGVGKGKINNVQKRLSMGGEGYRLAIKRLLNKRKEKLKAQKNRVQTGPSLFGRLKQKYPLHFLFFNILDEISISPEEKKFLEKEVLLATPSRNSFKNKGVSMD
jgi:TrpR-related protein YerC/YecD